MLNSVRASVLSGVFLLVLLVFSLGMYSVYYNWTPWQKAEEIRDIVKSLVKTGKILPDRSFYPRNQNMPDQRYTIHNKAAIAPGFLVLSRMDAETSRFVVDLIAPDGAVVHTWPVDYSGLVKGGSPQTILHGVKVLPDGSAIVEFDSGTALARIDACGTPQWLNQDGVFHHVVQAGDDGFWTWRAQAHANGDDQKIVRFDGDSGEITQTIDLIDVASSNLSNGLVTGIPQGFVFHREFWNWGMEDVFHPNDVEPLSGEMADAFAQFRAGDLLISLRSSNLVAVLDRDTHDIIWSMNGPWRQQHDPDWQPDGTITVFDNNLLRGRSQIVQVDPVTKASKVLFGGDGPGYYTSVMGQHQRLPNGNWLILSATEGRVIEVSQTGEPVREYSNVINAGYNAIVPFAEHLPENYFETFPSCSK